MSSPAADLGEALRAWWAEEVQVAVFRSLLAVEVLSLTVEGISVEMLDAIRAPLKDLYEASLEPGESW